MEFFVYRRSFLLLAKKSFTAIINMTYSWRVRFAMIHTEREREEPSCRRHDIHCSDRHAAERSEGALPGNEDRQAYRNTVRAAAGRKNYGTGAGGTV